MTLSRTAKELTESLQLIQGLPTQNVQHTLDLQAIADSQHLAGAEATRALIIDEGFGSLDDLGRQGMIDELHTLASQLDRVIVVSHQADFSDTAYFPNGYSLRKAGRHTEVSRLIA
jgi:DNA repair exonuclease SbcCD ATPase subunit